MFEIELAVALRWLWAATARMAISGCAQPVDDAIPRGGFCFLGLAAPLVISMANKTEIPITSGLN